MSFHEEQKERKLLWTPVFLGLGLWTYFSYIDYNAPWFIQRKYTNYKVSGTIVDIEEFEKRQRITLKGAKRTLKLSVPNKYPLRLYDQISGKADLTPMGAPSTPYSYDVRKDAYFKGIAGYGRMRWLHIEKRGPWSLRQYLNNHMKMHIKDPAAYGLAKAIVLGDKAGIHMDIKNAFSVSGISHLLAISGLHLMLFAGVIFFLLRIGLCLIPGMALRYNTKKAAAVMALCFAITYMVVSGYGYPVVRATIMFGLIMIGIIVDRTSLSMRSVAIAATIVLIATPQSVLSISFLLSFAAVIGLIAFYEHEDARSWTRGWLMSMILSTSVASLITMPICAIAFHNITMLSWFGNIIGIPFFTNIVMPLGMLSLMVHPYFYSWFELSLKILVKIAGLIALLPFGKIYVPPPENTWPLVLMIVGILWLCIWQKRWRYFGLIAFFVGILGYKPASIPDEFHHPDRDLHAVRQGSKLLTPQIRRGKFVLEEWARVYGLELQLQQ
jgi:competence protein ComEC